MLRESLAAQTSGRRLRFSTHYRVVKQRDRRILAPLGPRLGLASELNTGLPINHGVAAPGIVKISVALQNACLKMGLILFVILIVGGISYLVR